MTPSLDLALVSQAAVGGMPSAHTRRIYARHITAYLAWSNHQLPTRTLVQAYLLQLREALSVTPSSLNQSLSAIKRLADELCERGLLDHVTAQSIRSIHGVKQLGVRTGKWLTETDALTLTQTGSPRDRALASLMIGCGLRRSEVASLTWDHLTQRWDRWVIADLIGKGGRVRTIGIPDWVVPALIAYRNVYRPPRTDRQFIAQNRAQPTQNPVPETAPETADFGALPNPPQGPSESPTHPEVPAPALRRSQEPPVNRCAGVCPIPGSLFNLSSSGIWFVVARHAKKLGWEISPHDLRRTFVALAKKGGADIRQIQTELGHSSVQTTERYLGAISGLQRGESAGDHIRLKKSD